MASSSLTPSLLSATSVINRNVNHSFTTHFVTGIRYEASVAKMLNNMTFLYDPNWESANNDYQSLPVCFFFVKGWQEIKETQVSQSTVMISQSGSGAPFNVSTKAVMNVLADNIILQPKAYKLDVLLPFNTDAYFDQYQLDPGSLTDINAFLFTGANASPVLSTVSSIVATTVSVLRLLFKALTVELSVSSIFSMLLGQQELNKKSLDAMVDNRGLVKLKMWNGWRFKYLVIKSVELSKDGTEDGFYNGSITLQELPIMNLAIKKEIKKKLSLLNKILDAKVKKAVEKTLEAQEKHSEA